jgi:hypothetical protein
MEFIKSEHQYCIGIWRNGFRIGYIQFNPPNSSPRYSFDTGTFILTFEEMDQIVARAKEEIERFKTKKMIEI